MSVQQAFWIVCDACGEPCLQGNEFFPSAETVTAARAQAKREGWHYERRLNQLPPLDLCPVCLIRLEWREEDVEAFA